MGLAAGAVVLVLLALNLGALAAVGWRADPGSAVFRAADWAALRFTLLQAALSALISVVLAIPVARALARRRFPGRGALIVLMGAPFILPTLVAVVGVLAVFGRAGIANQALASFGIPPVSIYGLQGVLVAHVFFNLPLATRLILQGWGRIPAEHLRLAASLGFDRRAMWRHVEGPMLRQVVPGALAVIFLICLTSFAVALTLGGGPRATTLELAIYQAFRFEFDLGRAALLALVQAAVGIAALLMLARLALPVGALSGLDRAAPPAPGALLRGLDGAAIVLAAAFLLVPLALVVWRGAPHLLSLPGPVWTAVLQSLRVVALSVTLLALFTLALALATLWTRRGAWVFEPVGLSALVASPMVIGTGLFILTFPHADPARLALPVTALVNAAMALPFALRAVLPALRQAEADYARLSAALGLSTAAHLRLVLWPRLRRPFGFGLGLGAALSMGDLGVIVLFAQTGGETLPMQLHRLMGAYRTADAAGAALLLLILALGAFVLIERLVGGKEPRHAGT
ncbi:thiamine/thiamine pyrophosphate ABC transporter permease ThiP [Pararhodobacter sp. SW119]|uniref:thiamine/thiamine pyrophosphate ABC transporter permease ThiP n=1 Tax=Pararhodobacter sp. SW119 TaxID=2780075 RepID=UPI001ADF1930|nr:thiamine/thiamine pyrophosphate ABC transporter permease ThiP [Pararhodobacter sp. SW119]